MRTTHKELEAIAARLSRMTGRNLQLEWAYGQPRLHEVYPDTSMSDVSPRLPMGEMARWLWAFEQGLCYAPKDK